MTQEPKSLTRRKAPARMIYFWLILKTLASIFVVDPSVLVNFSIGRIPVFIGRAIACTMIAGRKIQSTNRG
jgi:hypothetical protein